jgi:hypothetical protein
MGLSAKTKKKLYKRNSLVGQYLTEPDIGISNIGLNTAESNIMFEIRWNFLKTNI